DRITAFAGNDKDMSAFHVPPFVPVSKQQPISDVGFYLTLLSRFLFALVARLVVTVRINVRGERNPLPVPRPHRPARAGRDLCNLLFVAAIRDHGPNLAAGYVGDFLTVRRPPW